MVGPVIDHLAAPDQHIDAANARAYDAHVADRFDDAEVGPAVALLAELAGNGRAVEFAVGTGRLALPLAAAGVDVLGLDASEPMLAELAKKPGADRIDVTIGDMASTQVCSNASLVYLVFNTITNLRSRARPGRLLPQRRCPPRPRRTVPDRERRAQTQATGTGRNHRGVRRLTRSPRLRRVRRSRRADLGVTPLLRRRRTRPHALRRRSATSGRRNST